MLHTVSTRIFMFASVVFGITGIALVFEMDQASPPTWVTQTFMISIIVILTSFAFSIATKYLGSR